jgi:hypothetical protein
MRTIPTQIEKKANSETVQNEENASSSIDTKLAEKGF